MSRKMPKKLKIVIFLKSSFNLSENINKITNGIKIWLNREDMDYYLYSNVT